MLQSKHKFFVFDLSILQILKKVRLLTILISNKNWGGFRKQIAEHLKRLARRLSSWNTNYPKISSFPLRVKLEEP